MSKATVLLFAIMGGLCAGQSGIAEGGALQQVNLDRAGVHKSDFNADGFADLAIGIRFEDVGTVTDAGAVSVLYGSVAGLQSTSPNDQLWTQDSPGVKDNAEVGDLFGTALATGDFNADGFADLAVGSPSEDVGTVSSAGAVNVLYGSAGGLQASSPEDQLWTQDSPGIKDTAEDGDQFGDALATGDFNADGYADLAVGSPFEDLGAAFDAGSVNVLYGSAGGLQASSPDDQLWTQDTASVKGTADAEDFLGAALASSDFNSDGFFDLAIGVPFESSIDDGAANVLYGSTAGLQATSPNDQLWSQDSPSVKGTGGDQDEFGTVLAARDFNGDGFADLAVAVPFDAVGTFPFAGAVNVLYGSAAGLQATSPNDQLWSQDSPSVKDTAGPDFEEFGGALAAGDLNGDGFADLGIGTPFEDVGTANQAGAVNVLYGSAAGLQATSPNDQLWSQDSPSVKDVAESGDSFGNSLTAKDFNGDGSADVAFGVPAEDGAGAVNTLYGSAAGLQATSPDDQFWTQDSPNVEDTAEASDWFGYALA